MGEVDADPFRDVWYINRDGEERSTAIFLQLELKGLGKLGSSLDDALERDILGYSSSTY